MADYELELPWPPSVNGYWRNFRGRQIISKRGREYRVAAIARLTELGLSNENLSGRLKLSVDLHPPTLRRYDVDNFFKAFMDALSHANFWLDDEQVDILRAAKCAKVKGGKIKIKVELITG